MDVKSKELAGWIKFLWGEMEWFYSEVASNTKSIDDVKFNEVELTQEEIEKTIEEIIDYNYAWKEPRKPSNITSGSPMWVNDYGDFVYSAKIWLKNNFKSSK